VLNPAAAWSSYESYMKRYRALAARFIDNYKKYADEASPEIQSAGPVLSEIAEGNIAL
jgi:phosphoenolpyruvate carboxykinase (ATP)